MSKCRRRKRLVVSMPRPPLRSIRARPKPARPPTPPAMQPAPGLPRLRFPPPAFRPAMARRHPVCKGFAVGRTIFARPAEDWLAGKINDQQAIQAMAAGYRRLIDAWEAAA